MQAHIAHLSRFRSFAQKALQARKIVRIDLVHSRRLQLLPDCLTLWPWLIWGRPEPNGPALPMGRLDDVLQFSSLGEGYLTIAFPGEELGPVVAQERHKGCWHIRGQI